MLEPEIEETQQLIDSMKNPQGWRDLKMLRAQQQMLDMIRKLAHELEEIKRGSRRKS